MNKNTYITIIVIAVVLAAIYFIFPSSRVSDSPSAKTTLTATTTTTNTATSTTLTTPSKNNMHIITIETNKGTIVFETYDSDAPKTVENFVTLANKGFYTEYGNLFIFNDFCSHFIIISIKFEKF
jgi:hypothetical protein